MNIKPALIFGVLLIITIFLLFKNCDFPNIAGGCEDSVKREIESPNKQFTASLILRGCGATTRDSAHLRIRKSSENYVFKNQSGFNLIQDYYDNENLKDKYSTELIDFSDFNGLEKSEPLKVTWRDDKTLFIECHNCPIYSLNFNKTSWQDINIKYKISLEN